MRNEYEQIAILTGRKKHDSNDTKDSKQRNFSMSTIFSNVENTLLENTDRSDEPTSEFPVELRDVRLPRD